MRNVFIATAFAQHNAEAARTQWRKVADQLGPKLPKLAAFLDQAETDVLAYPCVNPSLTLPMQQSAPARSPSLPLQCSASAALSEDIIGDSTEKMDTVVAELVSFFQALKSGSLFGYLILLAFVLTGLALIIVAVAYQRIVIKRFQTASKATQGSFETIAADLRKRALEVKKQDEGLRKRELEVKERKQQQVLKRSQRALHGRP
jgi:hypothetical protein